MIRCPNLDIATFALELINESTWYLPYRYNDRYDSTLRDALKSIPLAQKMWGRKWSRGKFVGRDETLQKSINKVRSKHTYAIL